MIAGILLTMRLLAEERQQGTDALLLTAPIQEGHIVVGKFLGALSFLLIITLGTIYMPLLIQINGKVSWGQIAAGYIGLSCLGASTIAIGTFGSTISKKSVVCCHHICCHFGIDALGMAARERLQHHLSIPYSLISPFLTNTSSLL